MVFIGLPRQVSTLAESDYTDLVAVLGTYKREMAIWVGIASDKMHYSTRLFGTLTQPPATDGVWVWGAASAVPASWGDGRLFAVRGDATVVTEDTGRRRMSVWRDGDRVREIAVPPFGVSVVRGAVVHDWLCLTSPVAGLVVIDIDSGETLRVIGEPGPDTRPRTPLLTGAFHVVAPAPSRGLAVCDGYSITIHDLSTSDIRVRVDVPDGIEARNLAVSPDGRFAVAATVSRSQWTVGSTGFAVFDLDHGRLVATLDGHKPYTRNPAFVCQGHLLATASSDRTVRLWEVGSWRQVDRIDFRPGADEPAAVAAWDAHDAFVVAGERGLAYVFTVSVGRGRVTHPAAASAPDSANAEPVPPTLLRPDPDDTGQTWSQYGWRFEVGAMGEDQFGGVPPGVVADSWPVCESCLHPMISVITLGAHPQRLPLRRHAAVSIFVCDSCESYDPYGGANAVLLLPLGPTGRLKQPPAGVEGETAVLNERVLVYTSERDEPDEDVILNKVAGSPDWMQTPEIPVCQTCQLPMAFVAQFSDELDEHLNLGYGVGYVFACPDEHDARFLSQC